MKYGQFCPIAKATEIIGERWTILIIRELLMGTTRFSDFQRALSQISPTLLTKRLGQLVDHNLVIRKTAANGKRVEYFLTASGKELGPIITELGAWGVRWARGQMSDDEMDVELLMYDMARNINPDTLPGGSTILHFTFLGLEKFSQWWIVVEDNACELCVDHPGKEPDLAIMTDIRSMIEFYTGDTSLSAIRRAGRMKVIGSKTLELSIAEWLPQMALAHVERPQPETV